MLVNSMLYKFVHSPLAGICFTYALYFLLLARLTDATGMSAGSCPSFRLRYAIHVFSSGGPAESRFTGLAYHLEPKAAKQQQKLGKTHDRLRARQLPCFAYDTHIAMEGFYFARLFLDFRRQLGAGQSSVSAYSLCREASCVTPYSSQLAFLHDVGTLWL